MKYAKEMYDVSFKLPVYIAVPDQFTDDEDVATLVEECGDSDCWEFPCEDVEVTVEKAFPCAEGVIVDIRESAGLHDELPKGALVYDLKYLVSSNDVDRFFLNMELEYAFDHASQAADARDADALIKLAERIQKLAEKMN